MPKQLYIPLPCAEARQSMVERQLGPGSSVQSALSEADMRKIVEKTAGYSGMPIVPSCCCLSLSRVQAQVQDAQQRVGTSTACALHMDAQSAQTVVETDAVAFILSACLALSSLLGMPQGLTCELSYKKHARGL